MSFISEDKKTINLPVPLGTIVYRFQTSCNDACLFQKEKFDKIFSPDREVKCDKNMPCHTILHSIQHIELKLSNLENILESWQITTFETEDEAKESGSKFIESHKHQLLTLGLSIE